MYKITFLLALLFPAWLISQTCLPDGITFTKQEQIDNFQYDYPNCSEIEGNVTISGDAIINMDGLYVLNSIYGDLKIDHVTNLISLSGLDNLDSIGNNIRLSDNSSLISLSGLENLADVGGGIYLYRNHSLTSLNGLNNLTNLHGPLHLHHNYALSSLSALISLTSITGSGLYIDSNIELIGLYGLNNLTSISGQLRITGNDMLSDLYALSNLTSISGELVIMDNEALTSLNGLHNIDNNSIIELTIIRNKALTICNIQPICKFLASPNGSISIHSNAAGCYNIIELANECGVTLTCLPYGNYFFIDQSDVDNFSSNYPGCTELEGSVIIGLGDVNDLNGLINVTSIGRDLGVYSANYLKQFSGLQNITNVSRIFINENDKLSSLKSLDNINAGSVEVIYIYNNRLLSECSIKSICDYLAKPDAMVNIHDNLTGCDSEEQVKEACEASSVNENPFSNSVHIQPNPFTSATEIKYKLIQPATITLGFYNQFGKKVDQIEQKQSAGKQHVVWSPENLPPGIYYFRLQADDQVTSGKVMKIQ
jgi:hypothetical protein